MGVYILRRGIDSVMWISVEKLRRHVAKGRTLKEFAEAAGVPMWRITKMARSEGIESKKGPRGPIGLNGLYGPRHELIARNATILLDRKNSMTLAAIGAKHGISKQAVHQIVKAEAG